MKRLRHPITSIREPFGKAGLTVAIFALVMALVGGAYAAGGLTKSQEKQVKKIAQKYAGKPGALGTNGTNGTNGAAGEKGAPGAPGSPGSPGEPGKGVVTTAITNAGLEGKCVGVGGTKVEVEGNASSKKYICNGSPWTVGTLPKGATETGNWGASGPSGHILSGISSGLTSPVSFNVPLAAAPANQMNLVGFPTKNLEECEAKSEPEKAACEATLTTEKEHCPGTLTEPKAAEGYFCLYTMEMSSGVTGLVSDAPEEETAPFAGFGKIGKSGGLILISSGSPSPDLSANGDWAVTAE
jgi:hypothetical protein